jgi:ubiquinone/menaquinone biosynthesis C-methylase UbiE
VSDSLWREKGIVRKYKKANELFPQERRLIEQLGPKLGEMDMLDLGVGAGRTTEFFAPLAKSYLGSDVSPEMVEACRSAFGHFGNSRFQVVDVRKIDAADESFDFVLFSFNGLDCVSPEDRLAGLSEIRRVLRPGGLFFFSAHNIRSLPRFLELQSDSLKRWFKSLRKSIKFRLKNKGLDWTGTKDDFVMVTDGVHSFRLSVYYVRPSYQVRQLEDAGFEQIEVWGESPEPLGPDEMDAASDFWLHYLCRKPETP